MLSFLFLLQVGDEIIFREPPPPQSVTTAIEAHCAGGKLSISFRSQPGKAGDILFIDVSGVRLPEKEIGKLEVALHGRGIDSASISDCYARDDGRLTAYVFMETGAARSKLMGLNSFIGFRIENDTVVLDK